MIVFNIRNAKKYFFSENQQENNKYTTASPVPITSKTDMIISTFIYDKHIQKTLKLNFKAV